MSRKHVPAVTVALAAGIASTAFWNVTGMGGGRTLLGIDDRLLIGLTAAVALAGLLTERTRTVTAVLVLLFCSYVLSARYHDGVFGAGSAGVAIGAALALFICWPRLIEVSPPND